MLYEFQVVNWIDKQLSTVMMPTSMMVIQLSSIWKFLKFLNQPPDPTENPTKSCLHPWLHEQWHSERVRLMSNLQLQVDLGWDGRHPSTIEWLKTVFFLPKGIMVLWIQPNIIEKWLWGKIHFDTSRHFLRGFTSQMKNDSLINTLDPSHMILSAEFGAPRIMVKTRDHITESGWRLASSHPFYTTQYKVHPPVYQVSYNKKWNKHLHS